MLVHTTIVYSTKRNGVLDKTRKKKDRKIEKRRRRRRRRRRPFLETLYTLIQTPTIKGEYI